MSAMFCPRVSSCGSVTFHSSNAMPRVVHRWATTARTAQPHESRCADCPQPRPGDCACAHTRGLRGPHGRCSAPAAHRHSWSGWLRNILDPCGRFAPTTVVHGSLESGGVPLPVPLCQFPPGPLLISQRSTLSRRRPNQCAALTRDRSLGHAIFPHHFRPLRIAHELFQDRPWSLRLPAAPRARQTASQVPSLLQASSPASSASAPTW